MPIHHPQQNSVSNNGAMATWSSCLINNVKISKNNRPARVSISITIISFQIPLSTLLSFGNDSFFDNHLNSTFLLTSSCLIMTVQLIFLIVNKPISPPKIMVYVPLLACTIVLTVLIYYYQFQGGIDGIKTLAINVAGLTTSGFAVILKLFIEERRLTLPLPEEQHSLNLITSMV